MGKLDITTTRPPLSESAEALRGALVDSAALARLMRRGFNVEVRKDGRIVGKRGPGLVKRP